MAWSVLPTTFAGKLRLGFVVVTTASIVLVCLILLPIDYFQNRLFALESLETQSQIIAIHSAAALRFSDVDAGAETLAALRAAPEIGAASLIDADGRLFASYQRPGLEGPPLDGQTDLARWEAEGWRVRTAPIEEDGRRLGSLRVAVDMTSVTRRLWRDMALAVAAALGCLVAANLLAARLRRVLYRPIAELARTASLVGEEQAYTARARVLGEDEFGRLTGVFNQMLDRLQEQRNEIQSANAQLRARNREMEQFVYTVSHDLKSPLVTITGFAGILRQDIAEGSTEGVAEATDHLLRAASKMSELIDDLLQLSRVGRVANEVQRVDVDRLVHDLVDELGERARAAGVELRVEGPLPPAHADRLRLTQVFENLLGNALKYGCTNPGPTITIGGHAAAEEILYFVRDNGVGIPLPYQERIWGLFQRLDSRAEGTGVGLAIVARIAEAHGGRAWLDSTPGEGATFWIAIPAQPASPAAELPRPTPEN